MTSTGPTPIRRLLVANRGEIASRVFRTCRDLGITTVAVHSDADAGLPYVAEADAAVRLPGTTPAETYLRGDLVVEAALAAGADAVHPGYGFLSENADFARQVVDAGLRWIGPSPESIEQMGSKVRAKEIAAEAGVPVLALRDGSFLTSSGTGGATEADLPLLVKASAGGGGRGMRVVRRLEDLAGEVAAAEAEAASAFGDGTVFVEPYVERGRHVEVQVVGSRDGVAVLGTRDCSLQRRHQKVVEEAPAPSLPDTVREAMHDAARRLAEAVGYLGAGTVELLYDEESERFWFLEMNTRLQVEHPVTELVHGVDLVAWQLDVVEGGGSSSQVLGTVGVQESGWLQPDGHAIEVRLYAEDPAADYQPQSGVLTRFEVPGGDGVRVDSGYVTGSAVSTHYDAMLAKVVAHGPDRRQAARRLAGVLRRARIHGVRTNRDQLVALLEEPAFLAAAVSTSFLAEHPPVSPGDPDGGAMTAAALALAERAGAARRTQRGVPVAWRNVTSQPQVTAFEGGHEVRWWGGRDGLQVEGHVVVSSGPDAVVLETDGVRTSYDVSVSGPAVDVDWSGGHVALRRAPRFTDPADAVAEGSLLAPMPGTVVAAPPADGASVAAGDPVVVLEAMKMQHTIQAPTDGVVSDLVAVGTQVAAGDVLAVVATPTEE